MPHFKFPGAGPRVHRFSAVAVSAIAIGLGSCTPNTPPTSAESPQTPASPAATTPQLQVVTTFLPMTQFTKAVTGDRAEVTQLLPTNVGPHDYQAQPEDVRKLSQARVLVKNGLEMEAFLENLIEGANNSNLRVIDSSQGIPVLESEDHGHDHGHDHGEQNPHIWLDPKRAIRQVENIRDGLIAADPEGKPVYTANAAAYIQQLQELDAETAKLLQPYAGQTFVAYHDFAPYFAQSYNLAVEFLVDVPEANPSPNDVKRVMDVVQRSNLKTLLTEPQGGGAFSALAKDLNVRVSTFDPMEAGGAEAVQPGYYLATMRQNVRNLVTAFTAQPTQSLLPLPMQRLAQPVSSWRPAAIVPQSVGLRF